MATVVVVLVAAETAETAAVWHWASTGLTLPIKIYYSLLAVVFYVCSKWTRAT